jgi:hypothetical protein
MQTQRIERSRSRRDERRERFEAKHHPEVVFEPTEDQALASDLAVNDLKASPAYFDARDSFALNAQVQMGGAL